MGALNERQRKFCFEYIKDFNSSRAARDAGYSEKTAGSIGSENLNKPEIQAFLAELMVRVASEVKKQQQNALWTAEELLSRIQEIADCDPLDAFDEFNKPKSLKDIPPAVRRTIASIDVYEDFTEGVEVGETTKIRFWDKGKHLEMLAKRLQLFIERKEVHNTHSLDFARVVSEKSTEELVSMANEKLKRLTK